MKKPRKRAKKQLSTVERRANAAHNKTVRSIISARRGSYASHIPAGYCDETELLLLSSLALTTRFAGRKKR